VTRNVCVDLFAGLGGFSAAFDDADDWRTLTVDIEERFDPDLLADVLDLRPSDLLYHLGYDRDEIETLVVLASPPCTAFSMAASGTHLDGDGRPVSPWGRESLALVHHTVGLITGLAPDWHFIENPMGGMRGVLGQPDAHIWFCQYGASRAKPTDLWGDLPPSFDARRCKNGNDDCHHESAPRGSDTGTQASDLSTAERAKLPYELSEAVRDAVENPGRVETERTTLEQYNGGETA
jgi:hypothetical protein